MSNLSRKIREARRRQGLSQAEFAKAIGVTQSTISKWESGAQRPDVSAAITLAVWAQEPSHAFFIEENEHALIVPDYDSTVYVVGAVESGKWMEKIEWDEEDQFKVQIPFMANMNTEGVRGWLVRDPQIENIYPLNSIVFCREASNVDEIGNYDRVLVVRENENYLFEVTLREIAKYKDIIINLRAHALPLDLTPDPNQSFDLKPLRLGPGIRTMRIAGVVVASFAFEPQRDPAPSAGWSYDNSLTNKKV